MGKLFDVRVMVLGVCVTLATVLAVFGLQRQDDAGLILVGGAVVVGFIGILAGAGVFTE